MKATVKQVLLFSYDLIYVIAKEVKCELSLRRLPRVCIANIPLLHRPLS